MSLQRFLVKMQYCRNAQNAAKCWNWLNLSRFWGVWRDEAAAVWCNGCVI
jgi:hypothetical protein